MNTKKSVLLAGFGGTILILVLFSLETSFCYASPFCMEIRRFFSNDIFLLVFLTLPIFVLSLITYKMRDEVFRAWWNFARWWVLVIIVATLLLTGASGGGTLGMNQDFTVFILGILYTILILTSLFKIIRAYSQSKGNW